MVRSQPEPELNGWGVLAGLPQEELRPLKLGTGQPFHDRDHLPPGVLLIDQGQMRLLGLDQRKEAFTLQRYCHGELVGAELLLRGVGNEIRFRREYKGTDEGCSSICLL